MTGMYIIKPDMVNEPDAMTFYKMFLNDNPKINLKEQYKIDDWVELSKILYEPDNIKNLEELRRVRMQLMTTIKGYEHFFKKQTAILSLIEIDDNYNLQELYDFKKELRKKFVVNGDKYYFKYDSINSQNLFKNKLVDIDTSQVNGSFLKLSNFEKEPCDDYQMIYFNKIHFPDPNEKSLDRDLECVKRLKIISDKNRVII